MRPGTYNPVFSCRVLLLVCVFLPASAVRAQNSLSPSAALDVPMDARSVAMAESFAGVSGDPSGAFYNPAGLSRIGSIRSSYSNRSGEWIRDLNLRYYSASLVVPTPLGTLGVLYHRSTAGPFEITNGIPVTADPVGAIAYRSNLLTIGFGRVITGGLSCGASIKGFDEKYYGVSGDPGLFYESKGCFLVDLGAQYATPGLLGESHIADTVTGGISIQNFGSDLLEQMSILHDPRPPAQMIRVPRYLRIGLSYAMRISASDPDALDPLRVLLSGAYRGLLNPLEFEADKRDYWGWGMEATLYECLMLRMGGYLDGWGSIYGMKGTPSLRYGIGCALPVLRLGVPVPLTIRFDYASIPLLPIAAFSGLQITSYLPVYSIGVSYEGSAF